MARITDLERQELEGRTWDVAGERGGQASRESMYEELVGPADYTKRQVDLALAQGVKVGLLTRTFKHGTTYYRQSR